MKTDKIDSETLAHLLRAGLLPESYVPPREIRELRDLVRRRAFLVGMRTKIKNRIHAELVKRGIDLGVSPFTKEYSPDDIVRDFSTHQNLIIVMFGYSALLRWISYANPVKIENKRTTSLT